MKRQTTRVQWPPPLNIRAQSARCHNRVTTGEQGPRVQAERGLRRRAGDHRPTLTSYSVQDADVGAGPTYRRRRWSIAHVRQKQTQMGEFKGCRRGALREDPEQWGVAHDLKTQTQELTGRRRRGWGALALGGRKTRGTKHAHVLKTKTTRVAVAATTQNTGTVSPFSQSTGALVTSRSGVHVLTTQTLGAHVLKTQTWKCLN